MKYFSYFFSFFVLLMFIALLGFIFYASIPGFAHYGIINILFTGDFDLKSNKVSIWLPLFITFLTSFFAILFATPIGIKTAIFLRYRLPDKYQKKLKVIVELLNNIPSVIFGLFAINSLGILVNFIFGNSTNYSILTASFMLSFMILPTIISLTYTSLKNIDISLLNSAIALGSTKTHAIYKICKNECRNSIVVCVIIAINRAIGETMAVSMILQSQSYNSTFNNGIWSIIVSRLRTLGSLISANMYGESSGPEFQGLLFVYGLLLFMFVILINLIISNLIKSKNKNVNRKFQKFSLLLSNFIYLIPMCIKSFCRKVRYTNKLNKEGKNRDIELKNKIAQISIYDLWKLFWEYFSVLIVFVFIAWILIDIFLNGFVGLFNNSTIFMYGKDTTCFALINTILLILISISISFPISLFVAISLSEYIKNAKVKKFLAFFIDSLGSTPSILFGMFGLLFFIQVLHLSSNGSTGRSFLAGILTIVIVILPIFIRLIQDSLEKVPYQVRLNSYALGLSKWETFVKIVLPEARLRIISSIILTIGRLLAETAPLYLTCGLSSSSSISLFSGNQTLTTRIYAQIYEPSVVKSFSIMYECAFITILLISLIFFIVYFAIPFWYEYKNSKDKSSLKYAINDNFAIKQSKQIQKRKLFFFKLLNNFYY